MSYHTLTNFLHCDASKGEDCSAFMDRHPSTISMSVLVIVEMFNSLNALSGGRAGPRGGRAGVSRIVHYKL